MARRALVISVCLCVLAAAAVHAQDTSAASANPAAAASTPRSTTSEELVNGTATKVNPLELPDCADLPITVGQRDLADQADIVLTGITLAAGPGAGEWRQCAVRGHVCVCAWPVLGRAADENAFALLPGRAS